MEPQKNIFPAPYEFLPIDIEEYEPVSPIDWKLSEDTIRAIDKLCDVLQEVFDELENSGS